MARFEKMREEVLAVNEDARNLSVPSFIKGGEEIRKLRTENIDLQAENEQLSKDKSDLSEAYEKLEEKMRQFLRSTGTGGLADPLASDDSWNMEGDEDLSLSSETGDSQVNGGGAGQSTPALAPAPGLSGSGPPGLGEGVKRRASDLSKVKDLTMDDVIWYKKSHGKENFGRFIKLVNHEKGTIEVEITDS